MAKWIFSIVVSLALLSSCGGGGGGNGGGNPNAPNPPAAPTNVTVTGGHNSIEVTWDGSALATSYTIYYSDSPGVSAQNGTQVTTLIRPMTITGLTNGTTYFVIVTASNAGGESSASAESQAVAVATVPARATLILAEPGDAQVTVSWVQQVDADSYTVTARPQIPNTPGVVFENVTSPFVIPNLENGVSHIVRVGGFNSAGGGPSSPEEFVTPTAPVPGWTPQIRISNLPGGAGLQDAAVNDQGVAAVLYDSGENGVSRLAISHNTDGSWSEREYLGDGAESGSVAITPDGDIHVANIPDTQNVYWRRYRNGNWSDTISIKEPSASFRRAQVKLTSDDVGNVFAVWVANIDESSNGGTTSGEVWARRFDAATSSWGDAVMIGDSDVGMAFPAIVAPATNQVLVAWLQATVPWDPDVIGGGPDRKVVYASRYDGTSWIFGSLIGFNDLVDFDTGRELAIDMNASGDGIVVWAQERSTSGSPDSFQLGASRFDSQLGQWSTPEVLDTVSSAHLSSPDVTIDLAGQITAIWEDGSNNQIGSSTFDSDTAIWGPVLPIPTASTGSVDLFTLATNSAGESLFLWTSTAGVRVRSLAPGSDTWSDSDFLGGRSRHRMRFHMSTNGHAIVVTDEVFRYYNDLAGGAFAATYSP